MRSDSTGTEGRFPPLHWWEWTALLAGLALFFFQVYQSAPQKSAIFDEQYHLAAGYSYLRTGDVRLATNHPPLMGMIAGLPLLREKAIVLPTDHPSWEAGDRFLFSDIFLWESNDNAKDLLARARVPIMLVGLLLIAGLFAMARELFGIWGGWLVFALAIFDPNLLAHSRFVTTDLGLTCFLFVATWQIWRYLDRGSWVGLAVSGLFAGLAMAAKYTGLLFWPGALLILLLYPTKEGWAAATKERLLGLAGIGLIALLTLWAIYGFDFSVADRLPFPFPLPAGAYWQNLTNTYFRIIGLTGAQLAFFMGEASDGGWPAYFPVALGVKTPLPTLILTLAGLIFMLVRGQWRRQVMLWALPLIFLVLGLSGILTIGYRHMLPAIPFVLMWAGNTTSWSLSLAGRRRTAGLAAQGALVLWLVVGTLRIYPHYESFFNEIAGDWSQWSNILVDSNLDWGQDLPALRNVMEEEGIERVNLAYFGKAVPEHYGVSYSPLPSYLRFVEGIELSAYNPYTPEPGWYAISATSLRLGLMQPENVDLYAYFRDLTPDARAGYSIYLYHIDYPAEMTVGRGQIAGQDIFSIPADAFGIDDDHRAMIKWTSSPETVVFPLGDGFTPPDDGTYHQVGADFDGVFELVGYIAPSTVPTTGETAALTLFWKRGEQPMPMPGPTRGRPLSTFVHLVHADTTDKAAQFDGWETALRGLEPGDIIAQSAPLPLAGVEAGEYDLLVGLYSPQDWTRLSVTADGQVSDHVLLDRWTVEAAP